VCRDGDIGNGDDLGSITACVMQVALSIGGVGGLSMIYLADFDRRAFLRYLRAGLLTGS
jgi:hypothetical protein